MSLAGSRPTLIANLSALVLAAVVTAEGAYIVHECLGYYAPQDAFGFFAPAAVMFIVRIPLFSFSFLALYVALLVQMLYQASILQSVPAACGGRDGPIGYMALFFVVSMFCLAIYAICAAVSFVSSLFDPERRGGWMINDE